MSWVLATVTSYRRGVCVVDSADFMLPGQRSRVIPNSDVKSITLADQSQIEIHFEEDSHSSGRVSQGSGK